MDKPIKIIKKRDIPLPVSTSETKPKPIQAKSLTWLETAQAEIQKARLADRALFHQLFS